MVRCWFSLHRLLAVTHLELRYYRVYCHAKTAHYVHARAEVCSAAGFECSRLQESTAAWLRRSLDEDLDTDLLNAGMATYRELRAGFKHGTRAELLEKLKRQGLSLRGCRLLSADSLRSPRQQQVGVCTHMVPVPI